MTTRRNFVAALVILCGIAITAGAALPWVTARGTRPASGITHTSLLGLRHFDYSHSTVTTSFAVAVAAAGILVVIGGLAAWRVVAGPFAAIALAAGGLWIVLNAHHYDPTDFRYSDLRMGAWLALGGGLLALLLTFWMRRVDDEADTSPWESMDALADDDGDDVEVAPPPRRSLMAQPGLRGYTPAFRPRYSYGQTRDGFRTIR